MIVVMDMSLLETRKQYNVSQTDVASALGVPIRTYIRYEQDDNYGSSIKREMMIDKINKLFEVNESKGVLTVDFIKDSLHTLFDEQYKDVIEFCYLFGSYAKGYAKENSDVDLCVSTTLTGLNFVGLIEDIKNTLHKKIDLIRFNTLNNNIELINEIMKDGIKIYG